jgi:hypothetical protein
MLRAHPSSLVRAAPAWTASKPAGTVFATSTARDMPKKIRGDSRSPITDRARPSSVPLVVAGQHVRSRRPRATSAPESPARQAAKIQTGRSRVFRRVARTADMATRRCVSIRWVAAAISVCACRATEPTVAQWRVLSVFWREIAGAGRVPPLISPCATAKCSNGVSCIIPVA